MEWLNELYESFYKALIPEQRYLAYLSGLRMTLLIAVFAVLLGAINLNWLINVILNVISLVSWGLSALFLQQFTTAAGETTIGLFSGTVSPWYLLGLGLFLLDLVIDIVAGLGLRKQKKTQPTIDQAVEQELKELRERELEQATEIA